MTTDTAIHRSPTQLDDHDSTGTIHDRRPRHEASPTSRTSRSRVALMVLTGAEIAVSYIGHRQGFMVPLLLVMMAVKFFTVVLYFMHLKYDNPLFRRLFYTGLFLALFVYIVALLTFHFFE